MVVTLQKMTLKHFLAMDTISTLKDKKSYERFQNLLDEVIITAEKIEYYSLARKQKLTEKLQKS